MTVLDFIIGSFLTIGLTYTFVRCDRLRMPELWRLRGWNQATTGAAIFSFAPLCIVAHFWVTRRSGVGLLKGLGALIFLVLLQVALSILYELAGLLALLAVVVFQPVALTVIAPIVLLALL